MKDAAATMDEAVRFALMMGVDCSGWMMQAAADGYIAWLYHQDAVGNQLSLFDEVEVHATAQLAAAWCLAVVRSHAEE